MVKTLAGIFLLCHFSLQVWVLPLSNDIMVSAVAQDATGTVWALPTFNTQTGTLNRWKAGRWMDQVIPEADGFYPSALTRDANGFVYVFWQISSEEKSQKPQCLVTVHRGGHSRILAQFSGSVVRDWGGIQMPGFYAGADGDVWLIGYQPLLWHISRNGSSTAFPIKPEQYFGGTLPDPSISPRLTSVVDGMGRNWFWQKGGYRIGQRSGLHGFLIWDGKTLAYHPTLHGMPDQSISAVARVDADHLWIAVGEDDTHGALVHGALYRVDIRTLSAVPVTQPQYGTFHNIVQIFQASGDWYAVVAGEQTRTNSLWRERAGQWHNCVSQIEELGGYYSSDAPYPSLSQPSGVWVGALGGAWWLPRNGKPPIWVNWRRGLAALITQGLFPMADGSILAVGTEGTAQIPATPQPIRPLPPGIITNGLGAPKYLGPLIADPRQHLWGTHDFSRSYPLDEWDGKRWQTHLLPKSITGIDSLYACDTLGRIWFTTTHWYPPAKPVAGRIVYDPARDTWTNYDTVPDALQAAAALPGMAFLPGHHLYQPPFFSSGRVTYIDNSTVMLYDGQVWRHWEPRDIQPSNPYGSLDDDPRFNPNGYLEVVLNTRFWQWTLQSGWQPTGEEWHRKPEPPLPPGGPNAPRSSAYVVDNLEGKWLTWQGAIYTERHGVWTKQSALSATGSPFRYGFPIQDVLCDPAGHVFFVTRPAGYYTFVVWSPPSVPKTTLSVIPIADDAIKVRLGTKLRGPHWFLWRVNGGAWSPPQTADSVKLTTLPQGNYRLEVQTLDRRLQSSAAPAVAMFSIRVSPNTQIARWVQALLSGTEDERETAVAGLIKQPDAALSALQAPHPGISESGRWWLEAAIQQIQDQKAKSTGNEMPSVIGP